LPQTGGKFQLMRTIPPNYRTAPRSVRKTKMNRMRLGILLFFSLMPLLYAGSATALAMPQDSEVSVIKADVTLVPVDAVVRDKNGALVDSLQINDFTVYDNGVAQAIALFSHEEMPLDVALVVDGSGSERSYVLELQNAALAVLQHLNPKKDQVALFCFGLGTIQLTGLTTDRLLLTHMIGKIPNMGGTDIKEALWEAAHFMRSRDPNRRRAIILISDNCESAESSKNNKETLDEMLEANAILYSIQTPGDNAGNIVANPKEIALLAGKTGGVVLNAKSVSDFHTALNSAIVSLKRSYTLGFYPSDKGKDGSYHTLKVKLTSYSDYGVQARAGYYVLGPSSSKIDKKTNEPDGRSRNSTPNFQGLLLPPTAPEFNNSSFISFFLQQIRQLENYDALLMQLSSDQRIHFAAAAKSYATPEGKINITIDLKIDAAQLFFQFVDGRYKGLLYVGILQNHKLIGGVRGYALSYSEEGFGQAVQSTIPLSITMSPPKPGDIQILVFQGPFSPLSFRVFRGMPSAIFGIQSVHPITEPQPSPLASPPQ
jgi:Ca-activated chloride channel homolog